MTIGDFNLDVQLMFKVNHDRSLMRSIRSADPEPRAVATGCYCQLWLERSGGFNLECLHPLATARGSASVALPSL